METRTDYFGNEVTTIAVFGLHDRFVGDFDKAWWKTVGVGPACSRVARFSS